MSMIKDGHAAKQTTVFVLWSPELGRAADANFEGWRCADTREEIRRQLRFGFGAA